MSDRIPERVLDAICETHWLCTEAGLRNIISIAQRTPIGEGMPVMVEPRPEPRIVGDAALLSITGPILPRASLLTSHSGATSLAAFEQEFETALGDAAAKRIVLAISSPGGAADGIAAAAERIYAGRRQKEVIAIASDVAASAALWLGSSASRFYATPTGIVGSLGVVLTARRDRASDDITIVSSVSPRKRQDPASAEGRTELQRIVDGLGRAFVSAVARNRGVSETHALEHFGQGGLLLADDATRAGLIDGIATLHELVGAPITSSPTVARQAAATPEDEDRERWDADSRLRVEFGFDKERWLAYRRARREGRARYAG